MRAPPVGGRRARTALPPCPCGGSPKPPRCGLPSQLNAGVQPRCARAPHPRHLRRPGCPTRSSPTPRASWWPLRRPTWASSTTWWSSGGTPARQRASCERAKGRQRCSARWGFAGGSCWCLSAQTPYTWLALPLARAPTAPLPRGPLPQGPASGEACAPVAGDYRCGDPRRPAVPDLFPSPLLFLPLAVTPRSNNCAQPCFGPPPPIPSSSHGAAAFFALLQVQPAHKRWRPQVSAAARPAMPEWARHGVGVWPADG